MTPARQSQTQSLKIDPVGYQKISQEEWISLVTRLNLKRRFTGVKVDPNRLSPSERLSQHHPRKLCDWTHFTSLCFHNKPKPLAHKTTRHATCSPFSLLKYHRQTSPFIAVPDLSLSKIRFCGRGVVHTIDSGRL